MKILPVLDILNGIVVRGVAGRRDEYRAVESRLVDQADAISVACAFRERFGLREIYLADLDAILEDRPNLSIYSELTEQGFSLMIDAGLREVSRAQELVDHGAKAVIAGLETVPGPELLGELVSNFDGERVIFSLDLKEGVPLGKLSGWSSSDPFAIAAEAVGCGVARMIVLDLAAVGTGGGLSTVTLCQKLKQEFPHLEVITGGGVRDGEDLRQLKQAGMDGVLVASALHNGGIDAEAIRGCCE